MAKGHQENSSSQPVRFYEVQYFWQQPLSWLVWIITGGALLWLNSIGAIYSAFAFIVMGLVVAILLLVMFTRLTTEISADGVSYRIWPFHKKNRFHSWDDITSAEVRQYKPIREYGGWGVRIGLQGKAYNIKGNMGLQLVLDSGLRILIGTQKPDEISETLNALGP